MNRFALSILTAFALVITSSSARAITLDWDAVTWTAGSYNGAFDIDPSNPGNDISVAVTANGGATFQPEVVSPFPMTPARNQSFQGGLAATENTLCFALNLASNAQSVTVTVSLSSLYTAGVNNVSFKIFDIDFVNGDGSAYQDQLSSIRGLSIDGTTLIAPTIITSLNNSLSGSGINQVVTGTAATSDLGAGSGDGNVTISFGTNAIQSFTFTYGSGPLFADPTFQHVGLYDLSFTPVPEIDPALLSIVSCLTAAGLVLHHRAKARK
jgi:hypothetical protein